MILEYVLTIIIEILYGCVLSFFGFDFTELAQITCDTSNDFNLRFCKNMKKLPFRPMPWMSGPWMQMTMINTMKREKDMYSRKIYSLKDGVGVALDFYPKNFKDTTPMLVICPGFAGSSKSRSIINLCQEARCQGWTCVIFMRRGHGGTVMYNKSGTTPKPFAYEKDIDDLIEVTEYLQKEYPNTQKGLVGLCVGGNLVVECLGRHQNHHYVGGISIGNGYDLYEFSKDLQIRFRLADAMLLKYQKQMAERHAVKGVDNAYDETTMRGFMERFYVPLYGYSTLSDWCKENSSHEYFLGVNVPLLCMASEDDPVTRVQLQHHAKRAAKTNENVISLVTKRGSHLGWMEKPGHAWSPRVIITFFKILFEYS